MLRRAEAEAAEEQAVLVSVGWCRAVPLRQEFEAPQEQLVL